MAPQFEHFSTFTPSATFSYLTRYLFGLLTSTYTITRPTTTATINNIAVASILSSPCEMTRVLRFRVARKDRLHSNLSADRIEYLQLNEVALCRRSRRSTVLLIHSIYSSE